MKEEQWQIFIRSAFNQYEKYYFIGTKEQLMCLIGCLHSTRLVQIEYIVYQKIFKKPQDIDQIKYQFNSVGGITIYYIQGGNEE